MSGGYSPELLKAVPRRRPEHDLLPVGEDVWRAWEISWIGADKKIFTALGLIRVPISSPCLIESKSLKLYLFSLTDSVFDSAAELSSVIARDLSRTAGMAVEVKLSDTEDEDWWPRRHSGHLLDGLTVPSHGEVIDSGSLRRAKTGRKGYEDVYTHLFRSRCPITGQPDWATVRIAYTGWAIDHSSLLAYLCSFRQFRAFHEFCADQIWCDISARCRPESLLIEASFLRRGGLDICPCRHSPGMDFLLPPRRLRQ